MPGWFASTIDRKTFFRASTVMLAGGLVQVIAPRFAHGASIANNRFALLSDTHIAADPKDQYRGFLPTTNLKAAIQDVRDYPCDMAFINGDAARLEGKSEDYQHLKTLLRPLVEHCPISIGLGNHDDRDNFRKTFEPTYDDSVKSSGRHVMLVESDHARWLVLDSLMYVDKAAGLLGKSQRTWLKNFLASSGSKPILILVHHTLGDNDGDLLDAGELLRMAKASPQVKAIFYGHSHQYHVKKDGELNLINLPAVGYNFADAEPVGWMECTLSNNGLKLKLHAIAGNQSKNGEESTIAWS